MTLNQLILNIKVTGKKVRNEEEKREEKGEGGQPLGPGHGHN